MLTLVKLRRAFYAAVVAASYAFWSVSCAGQTSTISAEVEFPPELVQFKAYDHNPVFAGAGPGRWDAQIRERGWMLRDGDQWRLWYTCYDGTREGQKLLGHATSPDGIRWTRDRQNPLIRDHWIEDMMVLRHDGTFYMFAEGRHDQAQWLTSPNGIKWERQGTLDIRTTDGKPLLPGPFGTPTVWREANVWYLMYERSDAAVWLATSSDLKTWIHVQDEPVLRPGPDEYDQVKIAVNQVIKYDGRYFAFYHGSGTAQPPRTWTTNVAMSTDRIHWKKYRGNPIVPGDRSSGILVRDDESDLNGKTADSRAVGDEFAAMQPARFRLYTMHGKVEAFLGESSKSKP